MEKCSKKRVALLMLPIIIFFIFISVSYALDIPATVKVLFGGLNVKISYPENTTYYTRYDIFKKTLVVRFKIDKKLLSYRSKYLMKYKLDDGPFVEIKTNAVYLTNLSLGGHRIVVYAEDKLGNSGSDAVYFTIEKRTCKNFFYIKTLQLCL